MVALNQLILVCLAYVVCLFAVAFLAERAALRGRADACRHDYAGPQSLVCRCGALPLRVVVCAN